MEKFKIVKIDKNKPKEELIDNSIKLGIKAAIVTGYVVILGAVLPTEQANLIPLLTAGFTGAFAGQNIIDLVASLYEMVKLSVKNNNEPELGGKLK